jgi:hypothetical protein
MRIDKSLGKESTYTPSSRPEDVCELEVILKRLRDSNNDFSEYTGKLGNLNDRIFGCVPEVASDNANKTESNGLVNAIYVELQETDRLRSWLVHEISRLEKLA